MVIIAYLTFIIYIGTHLFRRLNHLKWIICIETQQLVLQLFTETKGIYFVDV